MSTTNALLTPTPIEQIPFLVSKCRNEFNKGTTRSLLKRKEILRSIALMLDENEKYICEAVYKDFHRAPEETLIIEISLIRSEIYYFLNHLDEFAKNEQPRLDGALCFEKCEIQREPLGIILIIGAWNFPIQLTLLPLIGAVAAGNTIILKPSEIAPITANILQKLLYKYIPREIIEVVNGGVLETTALLKERFDHIFYTGSSNIAKIVMTAAAKYLTPVTLELGGKSPVIIDDSCEKDLKTVAKRIMWGKVLNAGQICIAPDYIIYQKKIKLKLIEALREAREELMPHNKLLQQGENNKNNEKNILLQEKEYKEDNFPSIININHFKRLIHLMEGGNIIIGGEVDKINLKIAPTVLIDIKPDNSLMKEEIFGPLLPLIPFDNINDLIPMINTKEKPLALYIFSNNQNFISNILSNTSSGGVLINDILMHASSSFLPFGGIGKSGMGCYHGKYSFNTFSHKRSIMRREIGKESLNNLRYPPYTNSKMKLMRILLKPDGEIKNIFWRKLGFLTTFIRFFTFGFHYFKYVMESSSKSKK